MNEHTQGPWLAPKPFAGGRFEVIGGTHIDTRQVALVGRLCDAYLVAAAPELLATAEKYLRELIADRDCHYDCCTNDVGEYTDEEDRMLTEQYDSDIDALRALLQRAHGDES
jgi:hypothetical protein